MIEDQYDITKVDKDNGNTYLHYLLQGRNYFFNYKLHKIWFGMLDPCSSIYVFKKPISLVNKNGETFYHTLIKRMMDI